MGPAPEFLWELIPAISLPFTDFTFLEIQRISLKNPDIFVKLLQRIHQE